MPGVRPLAIDLFSGAGGLSLGLEQAGFDVAVAVEYDPVHAMTHRFNMPDCRVLCRDVRRIVPADVRRALAAARPGSVDDGGEVLLDLVAGGPSCQGFSVGGKRDQDDERNGLLAEFVRLVVGLRPRAFLLENVRGLLEPRFADLRQEATRLLTNAGYRVRGLDRYVDAADFGVPQHRRRVICTGVLAGHGHPVDLAAAEGTVAVTVDDALDGLPRPDSYPELLTSDSVRLTIADAAARLATTSTYARRLAGLDRASDDYSAARAWDPAVVTNSLRTVHTDAVVARFASTTPGEPEKVSRLYRLAPDLPARTLRAGTGRERGSHTAPRPIHPAAARVITVREAARLHGYPDWFRLATTNWHGHRQIGNSVPPPLARAAGTSLLSTLGIAPRRPASKATLGSPEWLSMAPAAAAALLGASASETPSPRARSAR